jgi:hypothetical protein
MKTLLARSALLALFVLTLIAVAPSEVAAQWSFWSPGTPCADGVIPRLDGVGTLSPGSTNTLNLTDAPVNHTCFLVRACRRCARPSAAARSVPTPTS